MRRLVALAVLLAGCAAPAADPTEPSGAAPLEEAFDRYHDHTDASLHTARRGLELVNWSLLLPEDVGREGFAGLRIAGDHAFLATDGEYAGFLIIDIRDPRAPRLVSQYRTPGGASQEAVPSWDGSWVFVNLQRRLAATEIASDPTRGTGEGIHIVDVRDKARPRFAAFVPVEERGTHVMFYTERAGTKYLIYNGQPRGTVLPTGEVLTGPAGNAVKIAEFVESPVPTLRPVGEFRLPESLTARTSQGCFPHDMWAEEHPRTEQWLLYVAHWDCGAVLADITDPRAPRLVAVDNELAPSTRSRIHHFRPDPTPREGRVVAYSGPEIDLSPGEPGYLRVYDVTDPAKLHQVGHWRLPVDVENDKPFLFSPHNFDPRGDLLALAHYHAGVWVLDVSDPTRPRDVAFYLPHGAEDAPFRGEVWRKTPNFPEAYFPNVYDVRWYTSPTDGETYLLASERGSGLYVLRLVP